MQFNTIEFLGFFVLVMSAYFTLPARLHWPMLLAASYWFYMAWRPEYAVLLLASTVLDYGTSLMIARSSSKAARRFYLCLSIIGNFGLLFTFKYAGFFVHSTNSLLSAMGSPERLPVIDLLLPVGISFYTFQTISYTFEVYLGRQKPEPHLGRFALYVTYFPQLVAGPIERPQNLLPQLAQTHAFDYTRIRDGLMIMLWGMFKKVVVADRLASVVDHVYGNVDRYPGPILAMATVFFAFQIYCDFSGYSDIAIGAARVMGVDLMRNFNRPYIARSIPEFWKRWHISLSTWFRDYVYLPLGGNRVSTPRWLVNIMIVFTLSGFWHGANWTFVIWGALHGSYYVLGWLTRNLRQQAAHAVRLDHCPKLQSALSLAITFVLVCIAWVFFRANSVSDAVHVLQRIFVDWGHLSRAGGLGRIAGSMDMSLAALGITTFGILMVLLIEWFSGRDSIVEWLGPKPRWMRWAVYLALGWAIMNLGTTEEVPFVYFQF